MHEYLSTACMHEQHSRCIKTCKFCDAPCTCDCGHGRFPPHNHLADRLYRALEGMDRMPELTMGQRFDVVDTVIKVLRDIPRSGDGCAG